MLYLHLNANDCVLVQFDWTHPVWNTWKTWMTEMIFLLVMFYYHIQMAISANLIQCAHDFLSGKGCQDIFLVMWTPVVQWQSCARYYIVCMVGEDVLCMVILLISSMIFYHNTLIIQAYHKGLRYPQYVWITHGWYPEQWWNISQEINGNQTEKCSGEEMTAFLIGIIAIQPFPTADNRYVQTESGMVSSYIIKLWLYKTCN